jgi:hypothetical protein
MDRFVFDFLLPDVPSWPEVNVRRAQATPEETECGLLNLPLSQARRVTDVR